MRFITVQALVASAVFVSAQDSYGSDAPPSYGSSTTSTTPPPPPFEYQGCSRVDLSKFSNPIVFSDGSLTHAACQMACSGWQYAALFSDSCRCGNDASAVTPLAESDCNHPCTASGPEMCGSTCPGEGPSTSNVYTRSSPPHGKSSVSVSIGPSSIPSDGSAPEPAPETAPGNPTSVVASPPELPHETPGSTNPVLTIPNTPATAAPPLPGGEDHSTGPPGGSFIPGNRNKPDQGSAPTPSSTYTPSIVPPSVPGSHSTSLFSPSLSALGGLALFAVMIM